MGTIKTTNIETITGSGTLTLGQSGETISIPSGATLDLSNATQTGVGGTNTPSFRARRGSNQSIPNNTQTKIIFDTEEWDTNSAYDNATGRFTVPSGQAGKYLFAVNLRYNNSTTSASLNAVDVLINGSSVGTTAFDITGNQYHTNGGTVTYNLNAGDYVEVFNYQSTGGTIDIRVESFFTGIKLIGV